ncbi:Isopropylmalate/citramalate isomerase large subunit [uncultured archaeon]|nr:Isopropylmalate/citramalate isomerase large subunit [uncultured archaeon]
MSGKTLFEKVWDLHTVRQLPTGQTQLFVGLHFVHEVTSPQAFTMLKENNLKVAFPERTFATMDHIIPTDNNSRPVADEAAETMLSALESNAKESKITMFPWGSKNQGIVHVIGPETGLTQPGMTIACGDSHTSTHGALGALAFGIGTTQVGDVLATQCIAMNRLKVRKIEVHGKLPAGVYAKDAILAIIRKLGVNGGIGYAYEYSGDTIDNMSIEERMTLCNMSIEGGALVGYVNPDEKTFEYLKGKEYAPKGKDFERAVKYWKSLRSDADAHYDDVFSLDAGKLEPMIAWGINPGQSIGISEKFPVLEELPENARQTAELAYKHMGFVPGTSIEGVPVDVAFIGSCTNGRISDLKDAAGIVKGKHVAKKVRALVAAGSVAVKKQAEAEGLHKIFTDAGFEWRNPGCSMCLAMNPDRLSGSELCASSSNRNFIGRQGSPNGRTVLMSPAMVAAAAINGKITDVREIIG